MLLKIHNLHQWKYLRQDYDWRPKKERNLFYLSFLVTELGLPLKICAILLSGCDVCSLDDGYLFYNISTILRRYFNDKLSSKYR